MEKWPRWLAGWLESDFHIAFRGKSVGCLAGWLPGWLAGGVLSCVCMVNHFERVFTWLSDANLSFSQAVVWVFTILRNNFLEVFKAQSRFWKMLALAG